MSKSEFVEPINNVQCTMYNLQSCSCSDTGGYCKSLYIANGKLFIETALQIIVWAFGLFFYA